MSPACPRQDPAEVDLADPAIHDGGQYIIVVLEEHIPAHMAVETKIVLHITDIRAHNWLPVTGWRCRSASVDFGAVSQHGSPAANRPNM
jgi:hypothetical protein